MAELAEKTVSEMDKAARSVINAGSRRPSNIDPNDPPPVVATQSVNFDQGSEYGARSFDIFQHLDPSFDLNAVDFALGNDWELYQTDFGSFLPET
jgi:hypothetical protein